MNAFTEQIVRRFAELQAQARAINMRSGYDDQYADPEQFYAWAGSALNAIQGAFGNESPHYTNFKGELATIENNFVWQPKFESIRGIFLGAKSDVDGGHLFQVVRTVSGELLGDFVGAAKVALSEGHHTVAAVLGSAALEDALKRYAASQGLAVDGQTMESVINALKSKGFVSGAQKTLLAAMPRVRNLALHAEWAKLTREDAGSVVGFVEQFLLAKF